MIQSELCRPSYLTKHSAHLLRNFSGPEILSPVPRRHLLDPRTLNEHWTPSEASSSRPVSPSVSPSRTQNRRSLVSMVEEIDNANNSLNRSNSRSSLNSEKRSSARSKSGPAHEEPTMARRWTRWMHDRGLSTWIIPSSIVFATFVKYCISLGSYSGNVSTSFSSKVNSTNLCYRARNCADVW